MRYPNYVHQTGAHFSLFGVFSVLGSLVFLAFSILVGAPVRHAIILMFLIGLFLSGIGMLIGIMTKEQNAPR
jgi:hypothetical protein